MSVYCAGGRPEGRVRRAAPPEVPQRAVDRRAVLQRVPQDVRSGRQRRRHRMSIGALSRSFPIGIPIRPL